MDHLDSSRLCCTFLKNKIRHWFSEAGSSVSPPLHGLVLEKNQSVWTRSSPGTTYISGGDSSCSWDFYSCTGSNGGKGVDLVDCNTVCVLGGGGGHVATSIDQCVK